MRRPRYPKKFKTKRELLWYIRALKDVKLALIADIQAEEERYLSALDHMDFDEKGNVINESSVQPSPN